MPRLSGQVTEKWSGMPISGAVVIVNGVTVIADTNGMFAIQTSGQSAIVQVMHVQHETMTATVPMNGDTQIEITLTPTVRAL